MKKSLLTAIIIFITCLLLLPSCDPDYSMLAEQTSFSIGEDVTCLVTDENFLRQVEGVESAGETRYFSSNEAVATVNETTGEVDPLSYGTAFITVYNAGDQVFQPASDTYLLAVADTRFITTWSTDDSGVITIPVEHPSIANNYDYDYDYVIDWGDGNIDAGSSKTITHQYDTAGDYTISISGTFPAIFCGSTSEKKGELLSIENWGIIKWKNMFGAFMTCTKLVCNAHDVPDLSSVTDMSFMFAGVSSYNHDMSGWDVSNVTDMSNLFYGAISFNQDLSGWDVSNVTNMSMMFGFASSFNGNLSSWDVSNVTDMAAMFGFASSFNQELSVWDVSNVTNMKTMFVQATSFTSNLHDWNVSNVTDTSGMFMEASSFTSDLSDWDVSNVTGMENMFNNASSFNSNNLSAWNISNVTNHDDFSTGWGSGNTEPVWP